MVQTSGHSEQERGGVQIVENTVNTFTVEAIFKIPPPHKIHRYSLLVYFPSAWAISKNVEFQP